MEDGHYQFDLHMGVLQTGDDTVNIVRVVFHMCNNY